MSHELAEAGRAVYYYLPGGYSDVLRTQEFSEFFCDYRGACFTVRTQDGWSWSSSARRAPQFTATFRSREVLDSAVDEASEARLGRVFLDGALDLEGNIFVLLSVAQYALTHSDGMSPGLVQTIARISHGFSRRLLPIHKGAGTPSFHFAPCPLDRR